MIQSTILDGMKSAPVAMFAKNYRGEFLWVNEEFCAVAGEDSPSSVVGLTDSQLVWHKQNRVFLLGDNQVMKSRKTVYFHEVQDQSSGRKTITTQKTTLRDDQGGIIGVVGFFTENTYSLKTLKRIAADSYILSSDEEPKLLNSNDVKMIRLIALGFSSDAIIKRFSKPVYTALKNKLGCDNYADIYATIACSGMIHSIFNCDTPSL